MSAESRDEHDKTVIMNDQSSDPDSTRIDSLNSTRDLLDSSGRREVVSNAGHRTKLGRYSIERLLGQGGMGVVYLGIDDENGRQVAIKLLSRDIVPDEEAVHRFQKEARLLARVQHPHITNLLDVGEEAGDCFLVLEFVDGVDLKWLLAQEAPLSERLALLIIRDITEALAAAHKQRIVHRDIKPANILMTAVPDGAEGTADAVVSAVQSGCKPVVKLTDFGLARHMEPSVSMDLTRTGVALGTPTYMAPEQCTDAGGVGPVTDIYSLGTTLFEMLAGRPPFHADDAMKMMSLQCFSEPPDLLKLNPDVSDGTAQLVRKMLQKVPTERHVDAGHLLEDIDRLLRGETNDVTIHPRAPEPGATLLTAEWEWDLQASCEELWPFASNTERVNCAVGVPAVEYSTDRDEFGAVRKFGDVSPRLGDHEVGGASVRVGRRTSVGSAPRISARTFRMVPEHRRTRAARWRRHAPEALRANRPERSARPAAGPS